MKSIQKLFYQFIYVFSFITILGTTLLAQAPDTLWIKTFRFEGGDFGSCVQQTTDDGYVITGVVNFIKTPWTSARDLGLIKTDANGDTLWIKIFGDSSGLEAGSSVQQTNDGGYIVSGSGDGPGAGGIWLLKTDSNGDTVWTKNYIGNHGTSVKQTADGGYIVTGRGYNGVCLIKTNQMGDTLWTKVFGDTGDYGNSVQQTLDDGYIIAGKTESFGADSVDVLLLKTNANGDTVWIKTFGEGGIDRGHSVQQTNDGGYIITGYTESFGNGNSDVWLIKTNSMGDTLWTKTFGGSIDDYGNSVQQTADGGYIITGVTDYAPPLSDLWIIRTDAKGDTLWTKTMLGSGYYEGTFIQKTVDGGYIITGTNGGDIWLIKLAPDITAIKGPSRTIINNYVLSQNYPNPFNPSTTIEFTLPKSENVELKVYNILGRKVLTLVSKKLNQGNHSYQFDGQNLASGVYYYQLVAGNFHQVKKMIILK
jgi:hypothetical protein